ncbi:MAG TPA: hypothetical protein VGJ56_27935 [Reyranella sp.]
MSGHAAHQQSGVRHNAGFATLFYGKTHMNNCSTKFFGFEPSLSLDTTHLKKLYEEQGYPPVPRRFSATLDRNASPWGFAGSAARLVWLRDVREASGVFVAHCQLAERDTWADDLKLGQRIEFDTWIARLARPPRLTEVTWRFSSVRNVAVLGGDDLPPELLNAANDNQVGRIPPTGSGSV